MTTPIAAVLFDLGGVVYRFHPERRLQALTRDCGLPDVEVLRRYGFTIEPTFTGDEPCQPSA